MKLRRQRQTDLIVDCLYPKSVKDPARDQLIADVKTLLDDERQALAKSWHYAKQYSSDAGNDLIAKARAFIEQSDTMYEIKSPISDKINAVERNITRALAKCPNIIFDSSRMKVRDEQIIRELVKRRKMGKGIRKIILVNKRGMIIDIDAFI